MSDAPVPLVNPTPDAIIDFIVRVNGTPWPEDVAGITAYFGSLGCTAGEPAAYSDPVPGSTTGPLRCGGISLKDGSWATFNGQLFSLNFFFYSGRRDSQKLAAVGFDAVRDRINSRYGSPVDVGTDPNGNRSAYWTAGENSIELYGHVTLAPALQVGLGRRDVENIFNESFRHTEWR